MRVVWALLVWLPNMVGAFPTAMGIVETGHFRGTRSVSDSRSSTSYQSDEPPQQGKEIILEEVRKGDVKQSGAFGGQNFSIFSFKGSQMAIYMFSPFSIYFADEAQDNEVENEGDDASSKNQYLSQSKYGQQRGAGPTFLYQPNFDNRRRLNLIRRLLKRQKKKDDSEEATPIPLTITEPPPVIIEGASTRDIISKLLKSSSKKKTNKKSSSDSYDPGYGGPLLHGFPAPVPFGPSPVPFGAAPIPLPGAGPDFGALYG